jgi:NAD(P)-dependent dehydrogenase (short-subunit alcohol dehydrogenase family)
MFLINRRHSSPRVVVITGASAGVGRATARAFADRGAAVGLIARGAAGLEAAHREIVQAGGLAIRVEADVADAAAVEAAAERIETELGPIDVWVNNAMVTVLSPVKEMTSEEFQRITDVTYLGVVHGTQAALRRMLPRNDGVIIQVGSALAYRAIPLQSAYCAAKHAIQGFSESLRSELLHDGSKVQITMVQFPALNTPQFDWMLNRLPRHPQPVPPIYQPEIAADAIVWAAEHRPREVNVGSSTSLAVWGNKFIPGLLDRYLARTAFSGQQTLKPNKADHESNLWHPVDEERDFGAHGSFDDIARERSWHWLAVKERSKVMAGLGVLATLAFAHRAWHSRRSHSR